uniref:CRAL-TRIO domain-containing protein n=1 Tax=viral metagenome TaxID=1070528 RepID=A0A6C0KQ08_9ZZZZ
MDSHSQTIIKSINRNIKKEFIISKIQKGDLHFILNEFCFINNNYLILNYKYFKYFGCKETYKLILEYLTKKIDEILINNNLFTIYLNMNSLTISEIDKHYDFIKQMSFFFKQKYPNKLEKCFIYNTPFVFSQFYKIISIFLDKETQKKIEIIQ